MSNTRVPFTSTVVEEPAAGRVPEAPRDWADAARRCVEEIINHPMKSFDRVSELRSHIDAMIDKMGPESKEEVSKVDAAEHWAIFGSIGSAAAVREHSFANFIENDYIVPELIAQISAILVRKQRDYGHTNIARFGRAGLLVRCHDKVARLENLLGAGRVPENETVVDNFIDVIGYSAIGIMWEKGWFLLPLPAAE